MRISLYELFDLCDLTSVKICNIDHECECLFSCKIKKGKCRDNYERCMRLFATKIECTKYRPNGFAVCYIEDFLQNNVEVFNAFIEKNQNNLFCVKHEKQLYFNAFKTIISGSLAENVYEQFINAMD